MSFDDENSRRYQWKKVYHQIKVIVNELDPLAVGGVVDDEYDDLNFKIYAQLLLNTESSHLRHVIQTLIEEDYGVAINERDLEETVNKLQRISFDL